MMLRALLRSVLALPLGACAAGPPAVLDGGFPDGRCTLELARRVDATPLDPEEDSRVEELGRDEHTSHHLVWIRDREADRVLAHSACGPQVLRCSLAHQGQKLQ